MVFFSKAPYPTAVFELLDVFALNADIPNAVCAVAFLTYPTHVEDAADEIPFPAVLRNMVTSRALHYIAIKQGDNTTAMSVSDREIMELINLLT